MSNKLNNLTFKPNRLINETSPYLLQHAYNAVDWYPWGQEALDLAIKSNRPIFLSIGYSSCHWCHVMEHECCQNSDIAKIMNDNFINIKVDREERPDLDEVYMKATQIISRHGGWPMSVFLTPKLKPFYAGTYFPPQDRHNIPGFPKVLEAIVKLYKENPSDIEISANEILDVMCKIDTRESKGSENPDPFNVNINEITDIFLATADFTWGGFGSAPKFPNAGNLMLLLNIYTQNKNPKLAEFLTITLDKMAIGGIFDQLDGGFARYSTDHKWLIPHFEKMLYDNAQLARLYLRASVVFNNNFYLSIASKTINFVRDNLTSPDGAFLSSIDADSENKEGEYYVFTLDEIKENLSQAEFDFAVNVYDLKPNGNFEYNKNILYLSDTPEKLAVKLNYSGSDFKATLSKINQKLLNYRKSRISPGVDQKVLTSWNCLMILALKEAYVVTGDVSYLNDSIKALQFILNNLVDDGNLYHSITDNKRSILGFLDDWSYLIEALLEICAIVPKPEYLELALDFTDKVVDQFYTDNEFYYTGSGHEKLILRPKNIYDTVYPSGLSILTNDLIKLYKITNNKYYDDLVRQIVVKYRHQMLEIPQQWGYLLNAVINYKQPDILLLTDSSDEYNSFLKKLCQYNLQPLLTIVNASAFKLQDKSHFKDNNLLKQKVLQNNKTTLYYCQNFTCREPVQDVGELDKLLNN